MASGDERIVEASGLVNGINVDFSVGPYQSGSLYVFGNGQLWPADDDQTADELVPASGTFRLRVAPRDNDRVLTRFLEL